MGMYSSFDNEEIEVTDWEGLVEFMKMWREKFPDIEIGDDEHKMINEEDKSFTFESWDGIKLISYWYNYQVVFLNCVAKYIQGSVYWEFENDNEGGYVNFVDGKCEIHTGRMEWHKNEPRDLLREDETDKLEQYKDILLLNEL